MVTGSIGHAVKLQQKLGETGQAGPIFDILRHVSVLSQI